MILLASLFPLLVYPVANTVQVNCFTHTGPHQFTRFYTILTLLMGLPVKYRISKLQQPEIAHSRYTYTFNKCAKMQTVAQSLGLPECRVVGCKNVIRFCCFKRWQAILHCRLQLSHSKDFKFDLLFVVVYNQAGSSYLSDKII